MPPEAVPAQRGDILRSQTIIELPVTDILSVFDDAQRSGIQLSAGTYLRVLIFNDYDSDGHNKLSYDYRLGRIYPLVRYPDDE